MSENNIISALRCYANDEAKKQERQFKAEKAEYSKTHGPQEPKPINELVALDQKELAVEAAKHLASQFVGNPDGSLPCPSCFLRGKNNVLANDIRTGDGAVLHCAICDGLFHV